MKMPLWLFSNDTLTAMLADARNSITAHRGEEPGLTEAAARMVADEIRQEFRSRGKRLEEETKAEPMEDASTGEPSH